MGKYILAIDQGTTSSRAIIFDESGHAKGTAQEEFPQYFPNDGWVEHDPEEIWVSVLNVINAAVAQAGVSASDLCVAGITNQRETTVIWDRQTGEPIGRAIVWQDRRTSADCQQLKDEGLEAMFRAKTGLLLDPYFSATKVRWMLQHIEGAKEAADKGRLAFGTIDTFLIWRLTQGRVHRTDATNAARTGLFNIHQQCWDQDILNALQIPESLLPEVMDSSADFGRIDASILGEEILIGGVAGDQQAALIGQGCFETGMMKSTYGTGCFMILNTGSQPLSSDHALLTTVAYRLKGQVTYALEGSIFVAGAAVQWLRDKLKIIDHAGDTETIAASTEEPEGLVVVPAFTGLGAPYWDPEARGAILGLTRDTGDDAIVTATLTAVAYQTRDLLLAMRSDGLAPNLVRVDGGMVNNNWFAQRLADVLAVPVDRPANVETTVLGAAYLAGLQAGLYKSLEDLAFRWQLDRRFDAKWDQALIDQRYDGWTRAVQAVRHFSG